MFHAVSVQANAFLYKIFFKFNYTQLGLGNIEMINLILIISIGLSRFQRSKYHIDIYGFA